MSPASCATRSARACFRPTASPGSGPRRAAQVRTPAEAGCLQPRFRGHTRGAMRSRPDGRHALARAASRHATPPGDRPGRGQGSPRPGGPRRRMGGEIASSGTRFHRAGRGRRRPPIPAGRSAARSRGAGPRRRRDRAPGEAARGRRRPGDGAGLRRVSAPGRGRPRRGAARRDHRRPRREPDEPVPGRRGEGRRGGPPVHRRRRDGLLPERDVAGRPERPARGLDRGLPGPRQRLAQPLQQHPQPAHPGRPGAQPGRRRRRRGPPVLRRGVPRRLGPARPRRRRHPRPPVLRVGQLRAGPPRGIPRRRQAARRQLRRGVPRRGRRGGDRGRLRGAGPLRAGDPRRRRHDRADLALGAELPRPRPGLPERAHAGLRGPHGPDPPGQRLLPLPGDAGEPARRRGRAGGDEADRGPDRSGARDRAAAGRLAGRRAAGAVGRARCLRPRGAARHADPRGDPAGGLHGPAAAPAGGARRRHARGRLPAGHPLDPARRGGRSGRPGAGHRPRAGRGPGAGRGPRGDGPARRPLRRRAPIRRTAPTPGSRTARPSSPGSRLPRSSRSFPRASPASTSPRP